jgi:hypothetical protein
VGNSFEKIYEVGDNDDIVNYKNYKKNERKIKKEEVYMCDYGGK